MQTKQSVDLDDANEVEEVKIENPKFIKIPHLDDPEIQKGGSLDKNTKERPDFVVRLGTSLARKNSDSKAKALMRALTEKTNKILGIEPVFPKYIRPKDGKKFTLQRDRSLLNMSRALGKMSRGRRKLSVSTMMETTHEDHKEDAERVSKL